MLLIELIRNSFLLGYYIIYSKKCICKMLCYNFASLHIILHEETTHFTHPTMIQNNNTTSPEWITSTFPRRVCIGTHEGSGYEQLTAQQTNPITETKMLTRTSYISGDANWFWETFNQWLIIRAHVAYILTFFKLPWLKADQPGIPRANLHALEQVIFLNQSILCMYYCNV